MSSDVVVSIEHLTKAYRIRHSLKESTLVEQLAGRIRHPLRKTPTDTFFALDDINLEIRRGEVLGLVGRNGAGKSTLLKILSRITPPTKGEVRIQGRVGSLLEVGTGFHPELTGRENIYLNGSILGMKSSEVTRLFDQIVAFAGVERFLETPVKRYSSGMYLRLAFAVAAHLETDLLLLDEVLTVGDAEFQEKCFGAISSATGQGRAVVFVSHMMTAVTSACNCAVELAGGKLVRRGSPHEVVAAYLAAGGSESGQASALSEQGSFEATLTNTSIEPHGRLTMEVTIVRPPSERYYATVHARTVDGGRRFSIDTRFVAPWLDDSTTSMRIEIELPGLAPDDYIVDVDVRSGAVLDRIAGLRFQVAPVLPYPNSVGLNDIDGTPTMPLFSVAVST